MSARKRASAADTKPSPPPQTQETTTQIDPPIAPPKKALIFKFCLFFSIPYFYLLYQHYTIEQELRRSILINASLCVTGFFLTQRMIPVASRYVLKRGLFGFDINKKGTPQGTVKVPESLGIVVGIVFLVLAILFQYFNFTADSNWLVEYNAALASICFMILLGFVDDVLDVPWRVKLLLPSIAALPLLMAYAGHTTIIIPKPLISYVGQEGKMGGAADDFLNSESDKNDYEWLLTPPGTPLFPSLESQKTVMSQIGAPKASPTVLKSRLANPQPESAARSSLSPKQPALSPGLNSTGIRRPSSSGGPGSRPATPTGRPTLTGASKPTRSSTPTSRATLTSTRSSSSAAKPVTSAAKPAISATKSATKPLVHTSKPTVSAAKSASSATKPTVSARSATPTRSTARSSTPPARPSIPSSKPVSRAATPTRRPSSAANVSAPPIKSSPSVTKPTPSVSRNSVPSRGASPVVKSRPWKPSEMPGFSHDAPPNLRTTLPDRPLSATRGRPGAPSSRSSSVEPAPAGRPRRQSCSPSRGRLPNGSMLHVSGSSVPAISRGNSKVSDNVSPVVIGNKMVERVINMRKLVPPKQDDKHSPHGNLSVKSSSPDSSGFGRTLSKKSLDMAIRHMDIRRRIPGNLRPLMTNIPASSMYSVRSGPTRSRNISVSDSPLATSSNASSELSVNNNGICLDGSEIEDDIGSEIGGRSPASMHAR